MAVRAGGSWAALHVPQRSSLAKLSASITTLHLRLPACPVTHSKKIDKVEVMKVDGVDVNDYSNGGKNSWLKDMYCHLSVTVNNSQEEDRQSGSYQSIWSRCEWLVMEARRVDWRVFTVFRELTVSHFFTVTPPFFRPPVQFFQARYRQDGGF